MKRRHATSRLADLDSESQAESDLDRDGTAASQLMTAAEVAAFFRVSRYTVLEWSRRGTLPSIVLHTGPSRSVRRWRRADVEAVATPTTPAARPLRYSPRTGRSRG